MNNSAVVAQSILDPQIIFSVVVLILLLLTAVWARKKYPLVSFSIGWFFICLLPVSNIIPIQTFLAERYLYLPSFGFCLLSGYLLYRLYNLPLNQKGYSKVIAVIIFTFIAAFYLKASITRNTHWKDEITLCSVTVKQAPGSGIWHTNLGAAYSRQDEYQKAIQYYQKAIQINPALAKPHYNLGLSYHDLEEYEKAIQYFNKTIQLRPRFPKVYNNLGTTYIAIGNYEKAIQCYRRAIQLKPDFVDAQRNLEKALHLYCKSD